MHIEMVSMSMNKKKLKINSLGAWSAKTIEKHRLSKKQTMFNIICHSLLYWFYRIKIIGLISIILK